MQQELKDTKQIIDKAISDVLYHKNNETFIYDEIAVQTEISEFIMNKAMKINEENRYEAYFALVGKAVAIAQGWKQNYAKEIKTRAGSLESIQSYIKNTYGSYKEPTFLKSVLGK